MPEKIPFFVLKYNRGTQPKWKYNDIWYKADDLGYEGLSEQIASDILQKSNIENAVKYQAVLFSRGFKKYVGSKSENFRKWGERSIELNQILSNHQTDLGDICEKNGQSAEQEINETLSYVLNDIGLDYSEYLCKILEFDEFVLNPDRNGGNLMFLIHNNGSAIPIMFDNGRSFATIDMKHHPEWDAKKLIDNMEYQAMPYSMSFRTQANAAERICGVINLFRTSYTEKDLNDSLAKCEGIYSDKILQKYHEITTLQMERHPEYLLSEERRQANDEYQRRILQTFGEQFSCTEKNGDLIIISKENSDITMLLTTYNGKLHRIADGKTEEEISGFFDLRYADQLETIRKLSSYVDIIGKTRGSDCIYVTESPHHIYNTQPDEEILEQNRAREKESEQDLSL